MDTKHEYTLQCAAKIKLKCICLKKINETLKYKINCYCYRCKKKKITYGANVNHDV